MFQSEIPTDWEDYHEDCDEDCDACVLKNVKTMKMLMMATMMMTIGRSSYK